MIDAISAYGVSIGLAFQIVDDILDVEGRRPSSARRPARTPPPASRPTRRSMDWANRGGSRRRASTRAVTTLAGANLGGQLAAIARWVTARSH